jgi:zinc protease
MIESFSFSPITTAARRLAAAASLVTSPVAGRVKGRFTGLVKGITTGAVLAAMVPATSAQAIDIQRVVTPLGIEVWLVEEKTLPLIAMNFSFRGGAAQDEPETSGTATVLSAMLTEGAGGFDAEAFQTELEERAVRMSFSAGRDSFSGSLRTLAEEREDAFDLLALALTRPRFDADALDRVRGKLQASIRRDMANPNAMAGRAWSQAVFANHPYGRSVDGTPDSIARIDDEVLREFHRRTLARDNLVIGVVGDVNADEIKALVDRAFGGLPEKSELTPVQNVVLPGEGFVRPVELAVPQTVIRFGMRGLERDDPDFIPAFVLNHILGGGSFTSRLWFAVREERGLAYSVYSFLNPLDHVALWTGGTATSAAQADQAMDVIRQEIERMAEEGPSAEELEAAKRYLIGAFPLRFDTNSRIAQQLVGYQIDGLGIDYFIKRNDLVNAVTLDDVQRVAKRLFDESALYVVKVGQFGSDG